MDGEPTVPAEGGAAPAEFQPMPKKKKADNNKTSELMEEVKSSMPRIIKIDDLGEFQIGEVLGKGAFGVVYKAINVETGTFIAIKRLGTGAKIPKDRVEEMMGEIRLLKSLTHPNIVRYLGFAQDKMLNFALEFVSNGSLTDVVKKFGCFPETLAAVYIHQVLHGLRYLHDHHIVHRDIKGSNILIHADGQVKLADFGIATTLSDESTTVSVVGSPYWMAPEIIEMKETTPKADIWSVGCTIIELITAAAPYFNLGPMAAMFRMVEDEHPPFPDTISPNLKSFLAACFQKDVTQRASAAALLSLLWIRANDRSQPNRRNSPSVRDLTDAVAAHNDSIAGGRHRAKNVDPGTRHRHKHRHKHSSKTTPPDAVEQAPASAAAPEPTTTSKPAVAIPTERVSPPEMSPTAVAATGALPNINSGALSRGNTLNAQDLDDILDLLDDDGPRPAKTQPPSAAAVMAAMAAGEPPPVEVTKPRGFTMSKVTEPTPVVEEDDGFDDEEENTKTIQTFISPYALLRLEKQLKNRPDAQDLQTKGILQDGGGPRPSFSVSANEPTRPDDYARSASEPAANRKKKRVSVEVTDIEARVAALEAENRKLRDNLDSEGVLPASPDRSGASANGLRTVQSERNMTELLASYTSVDGESGEGSDPEVKVRRESKSKEKSKGKGKDKGKSKDKAKDKEKEADKSKAKTKDKEKTPETSKSAANYPTPAVLRRAESVSVVGKEKKEKEKEKDKEKDRLQTGSRAPTIRGGRKDDKNKDDNFDTPEDEMGSVPSMATGLGAITNLAIMLAGPARLPSVTLKLTGERDAVVNQQKLKAKLVALENHMQALQIATAATIGKDKEQLAAEIVRLTPFEARAKDLEAENAALRANNFQMTEAVTALTGTIAALQAELQAARQEAQQQLRDTNLTSSMCSTAGSELPMDDDESGYHSDSTSDAYMNMAPWRGSRLGVVSGDPTAAAQMGSPDAPSEKSHPTHHRQPSHDIRGSRARAASKIPAISVSEMKRVFAGGGSAPKPFRETSVALAAAVIAPSPTPSAPNTPGSARA